MFKITLDGKHYYDLEVEKDLEIFSSKLKSKVWDNIVTHLNDNVLTEVLDNCYKKNITFDFKKKEDQISFLKIYLNTISGDFNISKNNKTN